MAELNLQFYHGNDLYSDGDVEDKMLDIARMHHDIEDFEGESFPIIYHFSKIRHNILSWYPFEPECTILEIGAGCGALTGLLCQKASRVVSMELSHRRSKINYERHRECNNLEIIVGNAQDIQLEDNFDYIVVNGVLEYAMGFSDSKTPYEDFLLSLGKYLKKDGKILIAIENRLGLKYFAGAPEDHTDNFFLGLREYDENNTVRTFSKSELSDLLVRVGLGYFNFYYPYPDYKFPREIFTEEFLTKDRVGNEYYNVGAERFSLYDESKVAKSLAKEGIAGNFANSFLVEASKTKIIHETKPLYVKFSDARFPQYRIATKIEDIEGIRRVVKYPLSPEATGHIYATVRRAGEVLEKEDIQMLPSTLDGDKMIYEYVNTPSLCTEICDKISQYDTDGVMKIIDDFYKHLMCMGHMQNYNTSKFKSVFGDFTTEEKDLCICPANIDLIFDNVFYINDKYVVIDYEWCFDFNVPVSFIIWRGINDLYGKNKKINEFISQRRLLEQYGITIDKVQLYTMWNKYFCEQYVGSLRYEKISTGKRQLSLNDVMTQIKHDNYVSSSLYIDRGQGFSECDKMYVDATLEAEYIEVEYDISGIDNYKALRWDPIENKACICEILECVEGIKLIPENATSISENKAVFITNDPNYIIVNEEKITNIYIKFKLTILSTVQICNIIQDTIIKGKEENVKLKLCVAELQEKLEKLYSRRERKLLEKTRRFKEKK